jgi:acylphosphatase
MESGKTMKIRGTFIVDGIVQGVHYREEVQHIAHEHVLTGTVKNRKDGTVRIIAEGEEESVRNFGECINIVKGRIRVEEIIPKYSKATGQFRRFKIVYGPNVSEGDLEIMEKLDLGSFRMDEMKAALSEKLDVTNESIKEVGTNVMSVDVNVKAVGADVKAMDGHMADHFGRLDKKYGEFGETMKGVSRDIKCMAKDVKASRSDSKVMRKDMKVMSTSTKAMASDFRGLRTDIRSMATPRPKRARCKATIRHKAASRA